MTAGSAVRETTRRLELAGCGTPRVDAEILVAHVIGATRSGLVAADRALTSGEETELERLVERRARREPLAHVLGEWGFRRLTLAVDRRVLVPRPETEIVVERCLALLAARPQPRVLDIGTGSGAIALAVADECPDALVTGIDSSEDALAVARANAVATRLEIDLLRHDLFDGLPDGPWDVVVSNPPYVAPHEIDALAPEVRDWEPRAALVGEGATEAIARATLAALAPGGALVLEVADGDAGRIADLLGELGYRDIAVTRDLAGRDRVVEGVAGG